ncbi:MAG TPA: helix-turn-helix transcriptional regulator [Pirellulales bacterium]|jgi:transcriptional regulator with XRE-family HTH domain
MAESILDDNPQTVELLRSMTRLMVWMRSMQPSKRRRFWIALAECNDEQQAVVSRMLSVVENSQSIPADRQQALLAIADTLGLQSHDSQSELELAAPHDAAVDTQQAAFALRLRELMESKRVSQQELADRVGCSQPAISQMLNRSCRPQKKTILKLAEALSVNPRELWPDLEVAEMLDSVASFQEDDHVMTDAEAAALRDTSKRNSPTISVRSSPKRRR